MSHQWVLVILIVNHTQIHAAPKSQDKIKMVLQYLIIYACKNSFHRDHTIFSLMDLHIY